MNKSKNEAIDPITMKKYFQIHYFGFESKTKATKLSHFMKKVYHMHNLL